MNPEWSMSVQKSSAATLPCASTSAPPGHVPGRRRRERCGARPLGRQVERGPRPGMAGAAASGPVRHRPGLRLGRPQAPLRRGHHSP
jgi:hypothetical protein